MLINLLTDFWADLHEPKVFWQIAVVAFCLLASYLVSQFLHRRFPVDTKSADVDVVAEQLFAKLMFPCAMLVFLFMGKFFLLKWQHVYLLSMLIPFYVALVLIRLGGYLSRRIFATGKKIGAIHLFIEKTFIFGVSLVAILYYTGFLQDIQVFLDENVISVGRSKLSISEILRALFSVIVTVIVALWAGAALDRRIMGVRSLHSSLRMVLSRLGRTFLIIFAVLISLQLVGIDLTVLSVFGGALAVGMGLGLQRIASNYVSGFIILLDRSLSIDDMITVDKYSGRVSEINTRYTVLKGLDGVESVIPNEMLISSPVQNLSLTDREIWMSTDVTVAYDTDIEALLPKLAEAVSQVERVSKKLPPAANLANFGASGMELRIGFWINDPENGRLSLLSQVNRAIWKLLQEQKVQIPFPQREIRVLNEQK